MVKISERNYPLLSSFIEAELLEFPWGDRVVNGKTKDERIEEARQGYFSQLERELDKYEKADYIRIQSLSNMGLMYRELTLTAHPWVFGEDVIVLLPPAPPPRGGLSSSLKKR